MGTWKEYDTTADTGLEVFGCSREDLFATAAFAFTEMSTNPKSLDVGGIDGLKIECATDENDIMFREMLEVLIYQLEVHDRLPIAIHNISFKEDTIFINIIWGYWVDGQSESRTEIKAVTYHELDVHKVKDGEWYGRVIFDI